MTIEQVKNGDALTMTISGRLDTTTAPQLAEAFNAAVKDIQSLTLDMKGLDYISSAGLRVLLQMHKTMVQRDGLVIKNANETVKEVFGVTGFMDLLNVEA